MFWQPELKFLVSLVDSIIICHVYFSFFLFRLSSFWLILYVSSIRVGLTRSTLGVVSPPPSPALLEHSHLPHPSSPAPSLSPPIPRPIRQFNSQSILLAPASRLPASPPVLPLPPPRRSFAHQSIPLKPHLPFLCCSSVLLTSPPPHPPPPSPSKLGRSPLPASPIPRPPPPLRA